MLTNYIWNIMHLFSEQEKVIDGGYEGMHKVIIYALQKSLSSKKSLLSDRQYALLFELLERVDRQYFKMMDAMKVNRMLLMALKDPENNETT